MLKRFQKRTPEEKAEQRHRREKRRAYRRAAKEWEKQFPTLSCHPPYVLPEEMKKLEQILKECRQKLNL